MDKAIPDEIVDLIYLDPPFNSARNYNLLFKQHKGQESPAQIMAFEDTWQWNPLGNTGTRTLVYFEEEEAEELLEFSAMLLTLIYEFPAQLTLRRPRKPKS